MTVHLTKTANSIIVRARAEDESGARIGDLTVPVTREGSFAGWTYVELARLGDGRHEIEPKGPTTAD
jgi:hypothetical protein